MTFLLAGHFPIISHTFPGKGEEERGGERREAPGRCLYLKLVCFLLSSSFFFLLGPCLKCGYGTVERPKHGKEMRFELLNSKVQTTAVVSFGLTAFFPSRGCCLTFDHLKTAQRSRRLLFFRSLSSRRTILRAYCEFELRQ